jgi:hypothetical protein
MHICMFPTIQSRNFCFVVCCLKCKIRIYRILILPVVLYGRESCFLTLKEEHRGKEFEKGAENE